MPEIDLTFVDEAVERLGREPDKVIPILQEIQHHYRYLPDEALRRVCESTEITPSAITGVSTFYSQFRHRPMGEHLVKVCDGTACHVKGAEKLYDGLRTHLNIAADDDTDADREFTVEKVFCVGCCTLAPVVQIEDATYGNLTTEALPRMLHDFRAQLKDGNGAVPGPASGTNGRVQGEIRICLDSCCVARGCDDTFSEIHRSIAETGVSAAVKRVGCVVMCEQTPMVEIALPGQKPFVYSRVPPDRVKSIILRHFRPRSILHRVKNTVSAAIDALLTDEVWEPVTRYSSDVRDPPVAAFFGRQKHIATEHYGKLNPTCLDDYVGHDGYKALEKCLNDLSPEATIQQVEASGLRGRGGAGFPTARKWRIVREHQSERKYILCNGDEGDPGAFMDRMLMESFPYRVIEGMAIAAHAVGATEGRLYIRAEYPFAVLRMREALRHCNERGILGEATAENKQALNLEVFEGAGAFVCGEETAMLESIEGRRGIPRLRPPYPAESGLWGKPTLINNVETYAKIPWIIRNGPEAFTAVGTEKSKGTKVFALAGKVERGGLIEVPMGVTIQEIVEEIGGGIPNGGKLKGVLIGGPSGGCVPASLADTPVDYESLTNAGAIMGSGGLVVLDDFDCIVSIARYFMSFCQYESCGKCTYCRIGTRRMLDILDRLCEGNGKKGDIEEMETLSGLVKQGSLCGLGKTAPNPVISSLRHFREEFEAHVEGRCPAGVCQALIKYEITDNCVGCTKCAQHCPVDAIPMTPYQRHTIDSDTCTRCDTCRQVCPEKAIEIH